MGLCSAVQNLKMYNDTRGLVNKAVMRTGIAMNKANDDAWNIAEGKHNGYQSQIRYRPKLNLVSLQSKFPKLLTVVWEYESNETNNHLPYPEDYDSMQSFETILTDSFEEKNAGVITFIFTSNGQRKFCFYVNDIDVVTSILNAEVEPGLPIQLTVEEDKEWQEFKSILDLIGE